MNRGFGLDRPRGSFWMSLLGPRYVPDRENGGLKANETRIRVEYFLNGQEQPELRKKQVSVRKRGR